MDRWLDREAEKAFLQRYFARGQGMPVTLDIDGALVKAASETGGCPLCGSVLGIVGGMRVRCYVREWEDYAAVEWTGFLQNVGHATSPLLSEIMAADVEIGPVVGDVVVHHAHGSTSEATDFLPIETPLADGDAISMEPVAGRPSDGVLPFLNVAWEGGGVVVAIGWSGQWHAWVERRGDKVRLLIGQEHTYLRLHGGEEIRTPRVLLVFWRGDDPQVGNNVLRRLILEHYAPRHDDKVLLPPISNTTFFAFGDGNGATEENQIAIARRMAEIDAGFEVFWLDAGWFEGGWPGGAGSWVPRSDTFPNGLKPVADAAHENGFKFLLWFEPERVVEGSRIDREQGDFVLRDRGGSGGQEGGLFDLGDEAGREYLIALLGQAIQDWDIDVYRHDFNIQPLGFWRAADHSEREGMHEIRYLEGLYAMWRELRRRKPGLLIDNCAAGGRRIDLETISLSIPLWRSDTSGMEWPQPIVDQVQTAGLSLWTPLHSAGAWGCDPYTFWSVATAGVSFCPSVLSDDLDVEALRARIAELVRWRELWLKNFWLLTPVTTSAADWCAWQLHDPDEGKGVVMAFRRDEAPDTIELSLCEIDASAEYAVRDWYGGEEWQRPGADLSRLTIELAAAPGVAILEYARISAGA